MQSCEYHLVSANLSHSPNSERMALNKITLKHLALEKFTFVATVSQYVHKCNGFIKYG